MKYNGILLAFMFTACTPAEIALVEVLTEEALVIEKELENPPQVKVVPVEPPQVECLNAVQK